jgi:hypothetical protein
MLAYSQINFLNENLDIYSSSEVKDLKGEQTWEETPNTAAEEQEELEESKEETLIDDILIPDGLYNI